MPNQDGTGPKGLGSGTGRLRGGCAARRGNNRKKPVFGNRSGNRLGGGNGPCGAGTGRFLKSNTDNARNQ